MEQRVCVRNRGFACGTEGAQMAREAPSALDCDRQAISDGQESGHELIGVAQIVDHLAGDHGERVAARGGVIG